MTAALGAVAAIVLVAACAPRPSATGGVGASSGVPDTGARPPDDRIADVRLALPPEPRAPWRALVGGYAAGADTVLLLEDGGRLHLLGADSARRPLRALDSLATRLVVAAPAPAETLRVERRGDGAVVALVRGATRLARLAFAPEDGAAFRIVPQRPVEALRREALAAAPPPQPDSLRTPELVELVALDRTIHLDVRYATTNNFMGARFYEAPRAFLQRPAAEALVRAHHRLAALGYGIVVHDAYRPWYVTKMFWDATPPAQREFVADPRTGSRHNRGAAADVSLYDLATGREVEMPSGYDEFTPRAYADYPGGTSRQRALRALLRRAMEAEGFAVYPPEWWHFDHATWRHYPVANLRFEEIAPR
ncbi:MAG TPA: M15 family metallopeptidase [Gemmatimonadaceae bacterium]|nr:M15 family metallopeptidase [Gemmatimonadaceae bacterium]